MGADSNGAPCLKKVQELLLRQASLPVGGQKLPDVLPGHGPRRSLRRPTHRAEFPRPLRGAPPLHGCMRGSQEEVRRLRLALPDTHARTAKLSLRSPIM